MEREEIEGVVGRLMWMKRCSPIGCFLAHLSTFSDDVLVKSLPVYV